MGVQALADMSDVERKLALERYKLLEPHLQNGRELRSVSKDSDVSFRTLQRWVAGYKREGVVLLIRWPTLVRIIWHTIASCALQGVCSARFR